MATSSPHTTVDSNPTYTGTISPNLAGSTGASTNLVGSVQGAISGATGPNLPASSTGYSYNPTTGLYSSPTTPNVSYHASGQAVQNPNPGLFTTPQSINNSSSPSGFSSSALALSNQQIGGATSSATASLTPPPTANPYASLLFSSPGSQTIQSQTQPQQTTTTSPVKTSSDMQTNNTQTSAGTVTVPPAVDTSQFNTPAGSTGNTGNSQDNNTGNSQGPDINGMLNAATNNAAGFALTGMNVIQQAAQANLNSQLYTIAAQYDGQKASTDANYSAQSQQLAFQANNAIGAAAGIAARLDAFGPSATNQASIAKIGGYFAMAQTQLNTNWQAADIALQANDITAYQGAMQNYNSIVSNATQQAYGELATLSTSFSNAVISNYYNAQNLGLKQEGVNLNAIRTQNDVTRTQADITGTYTGSDGQTHYTVSGLNAMANQARVGIENTLKDVSVGTYVTGVAQRYSDYQNGIESIAGLTSMLQGNSGSVQTGLDVLNGVIGNPASQQAQTAAQLASTVSNIYKATYGTVPTSDQLKAIYSQAKNPGGLQSIVAGWAGQLNNTIQTNIKTDSGNSVLSGNSGIKGSMSYLTTLMQSPGYQAIVNNGQTQTNSTTGSNQPATLNTNYGVTVPSDFK